MSVSDIESRRLTGIMAIVGMVGLLSVACSPEPDDESEPDAGSESASVTESVGPEGGSIALEGASLKVPSGAVDEEVEITIEQTDAGAPDGLEAYSPVYRFRPEGLSFAEPVEVQLPVGEAGEEDRVVLFWTQPGGKESGEMLEYRSRPTSRVDGKAVAMVDHFSGGFSGKPRSCRGGSCPGVAQCVGGACFVIDCENGRKNGLETDVDCGGPHCGGCYDGKRCEVDTDCRGECLSSGRCVTPGDADAGMDAGSDGGVDTSVDADGGMSGDAGDTEVEQPDGGPMQDSGDASDADAGGSMPGATPGVQWVRLLGTADTEQIAGVSLDGAGHVYVAGWSAGDLGGTNKGSTDTFVAKYDTSGRLQWSTLVGSPELDPGTDVAADGTGPVYVSGTTGGDIGGQTNKGGYSDGFVAKFDASGQFQWARLAGTARKDTAKGVEVDGSGNVYLVGYTDGDLNGQTNDGGTQGYIVKYDATGKRQWTKLIGGNGTDEAWDVNADGSGGIYVAGKARTGLGGQMTYGSYDAMGAKYDANGTRQRVRLLGSGSSDFAWGGSVAGPDDVYVGGEAQGAIGGESFAGGHIDGFLARYVGGTHRWTRMIGTGKQDRVRGVEADGFGHVYAVGGTEAGLAGETYQGGGYDAFVVRYGSGGNRQWVDLLGTAKRDQARDVVADGSGNLYVVGVTAGNLGGQTNSGSYDGFIAKF